MKSTFGMSYGKRSPSPNKLLQTDTLDAIASLPCCRNGTRLKKCVRTEGTVFGLLVGLIVVYVIIGYVIYFG